MLHFVYGNKQWFEVIFNSQRDIFEIYSIFFLNWERKYIFFIDIDHFSVRCVKTPTALNRNNLVAPPPPSEYFVPKNAYLRMSSLVYDAAKNCRNIFKKFVYNFLNNGIY